MRDLHASQIKAAVEAVKARKEVNEVYFVACGGSQAVLMAGQYMFDKESSIPSHVYTANEFVYDTPKRLNENSVVISCSHSGNTPETVEATKLARSKGALTICLSNLEGSPLWEAAEYPVHYDWALVSHYGCHLWSTCLMGHWHLACVSDKQYLDRKSVV